MIILEADEGFADILQRRSADLPGESIYDLTHPDDLPTNRKFLDDLRQEGTPFDIAKRYVRPDGTFVWVDNHVTLYGAMQGSERLFATVTTIPEPPMHIPNRNLCEVAQKILSARAKRSRHLADLTLGEPDYDILLDLYVNHSFGRPVSITSACVAANVPTTTALRHISALIERGWVSREPDPMDKRRSNLLLGEGRATMLAQYLEEHARH